MTTSHTMQSHRKQADVACVDRDATLHEAARLLHERKVGSLVVVDGARRVVGIVTDRDLCLRAVAFGRDPHATTVGEVMTRDVQTAPHAGPREEWAGPMRRLGVRRVPLVDDEGRATAVYASDDWLRWLAGRIADVACTADPAHRHGPLRTPAVLLDELTEHLESRQLLDRVELLDAIARLRALVVR